MTDVPSHLKFAPSHEWVLDNGNGTVTVGISQEAQRLLGDIVYVDLPEVGQHVDAGAEFALIESVKAASDIFAPVTGEITEVNEELDESPATINEEPYEGGWIAKIKIEDESELVDLLDAGAYQESIES